MRADQNELAVVVSETSCDSADEDAGVTDVDVLEQILIGGSENERYAALALAVETRIDLRPELLQQIYAGDASESMRLLAFMTYADSVSEDRTDARAALESGVHNDNPAVQAEAHRRLSELEAYERMLAESPPQPWRP